MFVLYEAVLPKVMSEFPVENDWEISHDPVILGWIEDVVVMSNSLPKAALNANWLGEELTPLPSVDKGFIT